ncbi:hypothetical protein DUNSADRAFT_13126 [Dunaliella salina]|uniref:Encoded protein n=1 Tax=Dunaliella salina TaxID=3046 RepID=A0ABQ7GA22_DUNSA|nr:hypothetical protein DUNSADRAFT_13126 [Dunaliella salina]|eukprot:KAF5831451.1 hypothetical protein DUNSADRAFT_13126 [Dunaliella salina]
MRLRNRRNGPQEEPAASGEEESSGSGESEDNDHDYVARNGAASLYSLPKRLTRSAAATVQKVRSHSHKPATTSEPSRKRQRGHKQQEEEENEEEDEDDGDEVGAEGGQLSR